MAALWSKYRARMHERLDQVDAFLTSAHASSPDGELRRGAQREAHKLAGALGMFGLDQGTERARALEVGLAEDPLDVGRLRTTARDLRDLLDRHQPG